MWPFVGTLYGGSVTHTLAKGRSSSSLKAASGDNASTQAMMWSPTRHISPGLVTGAVLPQSCSASSIISKLSILSISACSNPVKLKSTSNSKSCSSFSLKRASSQLLSSPRRLRANSSSMISALDALETITALRFSMPSYSATMNRRCPSIM